MISMIFIGLILFLQTTLIIIIIIMRLYYLNENRTWGGRYIDKGEYESNTLVGEITNIKKKHEINQNE